MLAFRANVKRQAVTPPGQSDKVRQVMDTLKEVRPERIAFMIGYLCNNVQVYFRGLSEDKS